MEEVRKRLEEEQQKARRRYLLYRRAVEERERENRRRKEEARRKLEEERKKKIEEVQRKKALEEAKKKQQVDEARRKAEKARSSNNSSKGNAKSSAGNAADGLSAARGKSVNQGTIATPTSTAKNVDKLRVGDQQLRGSQGALMRYTASLSYQTEVKATVDSLPQQIGNQWGALKKKLFRSIHVPVTQISASRQQVLRCVRPSLLRASKVLRLANLS